MDEREKFEMIGKLTLEQVGFLCPKLGEQGYFVICKECCDPVEGAGFVPVYDDNIGDYWQTCCECHSLLHVGKNEHWPELFA